VPPAPFRELGLASAGITPVFRTIARQLWLSLSCSGIVISRLLHTGHFDLRFSSYEFGTGDPTKTRLLVDCNCVVLEAESGHTIALSSLCSSECLIVLEQMLRINNPF